MDEIYGVTGPLVNGGRQQWGGQELQMDGARQQRVDSAMRAVEQEAVLRLYGSVEALPGAAHNPARVCAAGIHEGVERKQL